MAVQVTKSGDRHYITGNTFPVKDQIKAAGCRWDPDVKGWWTDNENVAQKILVSLGGKPVSQKVSSKSEGRWNEVPLEGTEEGSIGKCQRRERGGGRGYKPDVSHEIGRVFRAGKGVRGALAGKVLICLGASAQYTSADWEEDAGQPGIGSGWWIYSYVREATDEEAAPVLAAEGAKASAAKAAQEAKGAERKAWDETLASATAGLVPTTYGSIPADQRKIADAPKDGGTTVQLCDGTRNGERVVLVHMSAYDDYRTTMYGSPAMIEELHREWAEKNGIDRQKALTWLTMYAGCFGQELYLQVAGITPGENAREQAKALLAQ